MEQIPTPKQPNSDEIDLVDLIRHIWYGRWLIAKVTLAFILLGLVIAYTTTEQFRVEARLLPEIRNTREGNTALLRQFSGIGGLGSLSMSGAEGIDAIRPDLYPDVLKSTPFFIGLMEHNIWVNIDGKMEEATVFNFLDEYQSSSFLEGVKKYTIRLPWTIRGWIRGHAIEELDFQGMDIPNISQMSQDQYNAIKILRACIGAGIDHKSGFITVSAEFNDSWVAAQIAQFAVGYLTDYITEYRIQKAQKDLEFVEKRHEEKRQEFHQAQFALARFRDANRNIVSAAAETEVQRLQDQYNLTFNVYNGLAQKLEQAQIKVQEETPVIIVMEPVSLPVERSKPNRGFFIVILTLLGVISGIAFIFAKNSWQAYVAPVLI